MKSMDRLHATYAWVAICCILMKICCFHGTTSKLYYPKTRPQGFLGSTCSGHLLLEVASWLPKKGHFFIFSRKFLFGYFLGFPGIFLDCFWIALGLQEGCPGALYPFLVELFQKNALGPGTHFLWRLSKKKEPGAWHPFLVEAFQKRGLGPGTL